MQFADPAFQKYNQSNDFTAMCFATMCVGKIKQVEI
jgi:hypothetical protein